MVEPNAFEKAICSVVPISIMLHFQPSEIKLVSGLGIKDKLSEKKSWRLSGNTLKSISMGTQSL